MAPSKLSPAERAIRKREAARLRQQRCRERKRQMKLKKQLETQHTKAAAEISATSALKYKVNKVTAPKKMILRNASREEHSLMLPEKQAVSRRPSYSSHETCPSFDSEPTTSTSGSFDEANAITQHATVESYHYRNSSRNMVAKNKIVHSVSPSSVMNFHSPNSYPLIQKLPLTPNLSSSESDRKYNHVQHQASQAIPSLPNNSEIAAIHAMLALKTEASPSMAGVSNSYGNEARDTRLSIRLQPQSNIRMENRMYPGVSMDTYHSDNMLSNRDERNVIRLQAMMHLHDKLNPGFYVHYRDD